MTPTNHFIKAAGDLIQSLIATLSPEEIQNLSGLIGAGAMMQIQTSWSRAGHVETVLVLIHPSGERDELAALELNEHRGAVS